MPSVKQRDEHYVLDLCDRVLGLRSARQHTFPFLRGDPDRHNRCRLLRVDAFYESLALVIEYRERQHSEPVPIMDRRPTLSGCSRAQQRRIYDERRRVELARNAIRLIELEYSDFEHDSRKRLRRTEAADIEVLRQKLAGLH